MRKREFKALLKNKTGCTVQADGWCCGTCFFAIPELNGYPSELKNQLWCSVLNYRGDYSLAQVEQTAKTVKANIIALGKIIRSK